MAEQSQSSRAEASGMMLRVTLWGSGDLPIVALGDIGREAEQSFRNLFRLAPETRDVRRRFRVVIVHAPDFDALGEDSAFPSMAAHAEMVHEVATRLGLRRFVLIGDGAGSNIALRIAVNHPEQISGLILVNGTAGSAGLWERAYGTLSANARRYLFTGYFAVFVYVHMRWLARAVAGIRGTVRSVTGELAAQVEALARAYNSHMFGPQVLTPEAAEYQQAFLNRDAVQLLNPETGVPLITSPTLLLFDAQHASDAERIRRALNNTTTRLMTGFRGRRENRVLDLRRAVASAIADFLAGIPPVVALSPAPDLPPLPLPLIPADNQGQHQQQPQVPLPPPPPPHQNNNNIEAEENGEEEEEQDEEEEEEEETDEEEEWDEDEEEEWDEDEEEEEDKSDDEDAPGGGGGGANPPPPPPPGGADDVDENPPANNPVYNRPGFRGVEWWRQRGGGPNNANECDVLLSRPRSRSLTSPIRTLEHAPLSGFTTTITLRSKGTLSPNNMLHSQKAPLALWFCRKYADECRSGVVAASSAVVTPALSFFQYENHVKESAFAVVGSQACANQLAAAVLNLRQLMQSAEGRERLSAVLSFRPAFGERESLHRRDFQHFFAMIATVFFQAAAQYNDIPSLGVTEIGQKMEENEDLDSFLKIAAKFSLRYRLCSPPKGGYCGTEERPYPDETCSVTIEEFNDTKKASGVKEEAEQYWTQYFYRNDQHWKMPPKSLAFLGIGGEGSINSHWVLNWQSSVWAAKFGANLYALEHRFYGDSVPPVENYSTPNPILRLFTLVARTENGCRSCTNPIPPTNCMNMLVGTIPVFDIQRVPDSLSPKCDSTTGNCWSVDQASTGVIETVFGARRFQPSDSVCTTSSAPVLTQVDYFQHKQIVQNSVKRYGTHGCADDNIETFFTLFPQKAYQSKEGGQKMVAKALNDCDDEAAAAAGWRGKKRVYVDDRDYWLMGDDTFGDNSLSTVVQYDDDDQEGIAVSELNHRRLIRRQQRRKNFEMAMMMKELPLPETDRPQRDECPGSSSECRCRTPCDDSVNCLHGQI